MAHPGLLSERTRRAAEAREHNRLAYATKIAERKREHEQAGKRELRAQRLRDAKKGPSAQSGRAALTSPGNLTRESEEQLRRVLVRP